MTDAGNMVNVFHRATIGEIRFKFYDSLLENNNKAVLI